MSVDADGRLPHHPRRHRVVRLSAPTLADHAIWRVQRHFSPAVRPDQAAHSRRAAQHHRFARRPAGGVRALEGRERSGQLPVGAGSGSRLRGRAPRGRSDRAALRPGRGRPAAGGARPPGAGSRERRGVVAYATDAAVTVAAFALSGRLFAAGLVSGAARELAVDGPVFDPRPDPLARRLAYVSDRRLRVAELDGTSRELAGDDDPDVSWGSAEFIAAEEMDRDRGYWWAPDGSAVVAARGGHQPGRPVVDQRPRRPQHAADRARLPGGGDGQCRCDALGARPRRRPARDPVGPRARSRTWPTCSGPSRTGSC